jgi:hypothetical protein
LIYKLIQITLLGVESVGSIFSLQGRYENKNIAQEIFQKFSFLGLRQCSESQVFLPFNVPL